MNGAGDRFYPRVFALVTAAVLTGALFVILRPFLEAILWSMLAAFLLSVLAGRQLGKGYSVNLGVRPGQPLVTTGLYGVVRHPGYMSLLIGFVDNR